MPLLFAYAGTVVPAYHDIGSLVYSRLSRQLNQERCSLLLVQDCAALKPQLFPKAPPILEPKPPPRWIPWPPIAQPP